MRVTRAMIPFLAAATLLAATAVASAQPMPQPRAAPPPNTMPPPAYPNAGYGPPPPPPPYMAAGPQYITRRGFFGGVSFGVGGMGTQTGAINCIDCDGDPLAGGMNGHVGYLITPRLALMVEFSGSAKQLDAVGANMFTQSMGLISAQYWLRPRLWIRAGLGAAFASLTFDDGWAQEDYAIADGGALSASIGYEIMSTPRFAIDLFGRVGVGIYQGTNEQGQDYADQIESGHIGVGFNWF